MWPRRLPGVPSDDGPEDRHPGDARHVAEHFGQLKVPQLEGVLHGQDVRGAMLDELCAMAEEGPQDAQFIVRSERAGQQAEGVKLLQPLGVVVVRLPTRHDCAVARICGVQEHRSQPARRLTAAASAGGRSLHRGYNPVHASAAGEPRDVSRTATGAKVTPGQTELLDNLGALRRGMAATVVLKSILDDDWFDVIEQTIRSDSPSHTIPADPTGFLYDFCHPLRGVDWFERDQELALAGHDLWLEPQRREGSDPFAWASWRPAATFFAPLLAKAAGMAPNAATDALHVAIAAVHGMDYLLSWNCTHIANATIRRAIDKQCRASGYEPPVICTPQELIER